MKSSVFWDVTPCDSCKNRRFWGTYRLHHQGGMNQRARSNDSSVSQLLVTVSIVPSSPILVTLMIEAPCSSKTSVLIRTTSSNIPEDGILHSHCSESPKSYIVELSQIHVLWWGRDRLRLAGNWSHIRPSHRLSILAHKYLFHDFMQAAINSQMLPCSCRRLLLAVSSHYSWLCHEEDETTRLSSPLISSQNGFNRIFDLTLNKLISH
jgi:hypothetical protein